MPSEQRLHPASLLFAFGRSVRSFAVPGLIAAFGLGRASVPWRPGPDDGRTPDTWELWLMLLIVPSVMAALARYASFRLRYDESELVIRSGIVFRNERHVPYHRIQNLDAVQNVLHRALRVIEVRIDTGASEEPEATISVLPEAAFADMRRRVFAGRLPAADAASPAPSAGEEGQTLLRLPTRELLLCGFLENRGLVVIATLYGLLWEVGVLAPVSNRLFEDGAYAPGMVGNMMRTIAAGNRLPLAEIALVSSGIAVLLLFVRALSMVWAVVRLYGFRLWRVGDDLRTEFGLTTRVSATIPIRRLQSVTIRAPLLYRAFGRARVRVETAGGSGRPGGQQKGPQREPLAPIIRAGEVPSLIAQLVPEVDATRFDWQPPHPRAFRRAVKPALVLAFLISVTAALAIHWRTLFAAPFVAGWLVFVTYKQVQHLAWAATADVVAFRSGWLGRGLTIVPIARIQALRRIETPFDRRTGMARVRVDTAGANPMSHRIDIPYLPRDVAFGLHHRLAAGAAASAFRW